MKVMNRASVSTLKVDVKVMRVGKKQVTMSMFRQIEEKPIFHFDGTLAAEPWGWVNYTWKESPKDTLFYVVYEEGGSIFRTPILGNGEQQYRGVEAMFPDYNSLVIPINRIKDDLSYGHSAYFHYQQVEEAYHDFSWLETEFKKIPTEKDEEFIWEHYFDPDLYRTVFEKIIDKWCSVAEWDYDSPIKVENLNKDSYAILDEEMSKAVEDIKRKWDDFFNANEEESLEILRGLDLLFIAV